VFLYEWNLEHDAGQKPDDPSKQSVRPLYLWRTYSMNAIEAYSKNAVLELWQTKKSGKEKKGNKIT